MARLRYTIRLPAPDSCRPGRLARLVARLTSARVEAFHLCPDEERFARDLLSRRTQLWLFRSNQRLFCGDFVVVDMSERDPSRRTAVVVDLKLGAPLRVGGGGCGIQLRNADAAVRELGRVTRILLSDAPRITRVVGDRCAVLTHLGVSMAS